MSPHLQPVFAQLRRILMKHASEFEVGLDGPGHYGLEAPIGPAKSQAWGGKVSTSTVPVAWVQVDKDHVTFHLMGVYGNPRLLDGLSQSLRSHMDGESCFAFRRLDDSLLTELEQLTGESVACLKNTGCISSRNAPEHRSRRPLAGAYPGSTVSLED